MAAPPALSSVSPGLTFPWSYATRDLTVNPQWGNSLLRVRWRPVRKRLNGSGVISRVITVRPAARNAAAMVNGRRSAVGPYLNEKGPGFPGLSHLDLSFPGRALGDAVPGGELDSS